MKFVLTLPVHFSNIIDTWKDFSFESLSEKQWQDKVNQLSDKKLSWSAYRLSVKKIQGPHLSAA